MTCVPVSVDGNNNSSDTGVGMQMATPCAVTHCELADTTTQLRNLIDKMHCLNSTTRRSTAELSVPEHCDVGLDDRLRDIRLCHAGAAAIRRQRQVAKLHSDF